MAFDVKNTSIQITAVDKTKVAFDSVRSSMSGLSSALGGLTAALGLGAFAAMTKRTIDQADAFNDLSKRTGIAVEQIGAWRLITEQSGTSMETLAKALGKGSQYLVKHGDDLKKIGINAKNSEELILQLSGVISKMDSDDPRRTALAMQVLGKSAGELIPLLSEGEAGLRKWLDRGRELNPITQQLASESDQFNDTLAEMKLQASGLGVAIVKDLLPGLNTFLQKMQMAAENGNAFSGFFGAIYDGMQTTRGRVTSRQRVNEEIPERMNFLSGSLQNKSITNDQRYRVGLELQSLANEKNNLMRSLGMIKDEKKSFTTDAKFDEAALNSFLKADGSSEKTKRDTVGDRIREMERENALLAQGKTLEEARMIARLQADGASKQQIETILRLTGAQTQWEVSQKASEKTQDDLKKATEDYNDAMRDMLKTADEAVIGAQREYEDSQRALQVMQLGESAVIRMEAARLQESVATYEQGLAYAKLNGLSQENIDFTEAQILKLKQLSQARLGLADSADARTAFEKEKERIEDLEKEQKKSADEVLRYQKEGYKELSQALTNGFFDSFKKGESFGKAMLKNLLAYGKTFAARLLEGLFTGGAGGLAALFSGNANAAASGSNSTLGGLGSIGDIFKSGNDSIVSGIGSLGQTLSAFGSTGTGFFKDLASSIGSFTSLNASMISNVLPFAGAAFSLLTGNVKGAIGSALGAALTFTPLGPIGGIIGSLLGGAFGSKPKTKKFSAGANTTFENGALNSSQGLSGIAGYGRQLGGQDSLIALGEAFSKTLGALFKSFDLADKITTSSSIFQRSSKKTRSWAYFGAQFGSGGGFSAQPVGGRQDAQSTMNQLVEWVLGTGLTTGIKASKLPDGVKKFFENISKKEDVLDAVNALVGINDQLDDLPKVFDAIRNAIDTTLYDTSIADLKTRFAAVGTYTSLFYTAEEQFATFTKQLTTQLTALDAPLLSTREQFRALVDGISVVDKATSDQFNGLVALAPSMDAYFKQLEAQAAAQKEAADAAALRDSALFETAFDYRRYSGVANNYGAAFASNYVDGLTQYPVDAPNLSGVNGVTFSAPNIGSVGVENSDLITVVRSLLAELSELKNNTKAENIGLNLKADRTMKAVEQLNADGIILREKDNANSDVVLKVMVV